MRDPGVICALRRRRAPLVACGVLVVLMVRLMMMAMVARLVGGRLGECSAGK
jgi:hypothetical protein